MFKSILILITCAVVLIFGTIFIQETVYAPKEINVIYEGIYFDFDDVEFNKSVDISVKGSIIKDTWLNPKAFTGTLTINSSTIEFIKPILFSKLGKNYHLNLHNSEKENEWKFSSNHFFEQFDSNTDWSIYMDKKFTKISFVPLFLGRGSTERITAPCNNREDAMRIARMLMSPN
jgi:hypothetical protein